METYTIKLLHKILNEVPKGKTYKIELGETRSIHQLYEYTDSLNFTSTVYEKREEVIKAIVHNGCVEIHRRYTTHSVFNGRRSKTRDETVIEFIPFSQITNIIYTDIKQ